ncbi:MAG: isoprenylcysteine carboxylmethyltransferase family protein [Candidatus Omnitrophica bacterium]|nr:isoprenylcysteine carboxylmethyltransferase family protein [Candidatus Omnitrophota bacterium]
MKKRLKINGIIMVCAGIGVILYPNVFFRSYSVGFWEKGLGIIGFSLILLGQIIRVCARGYKAENSQDSQALIQGGPYQVVRNPMYVGIFLIGLGVVLAVFKWWAAAIFIIVFIIRYILLIYKEENKLLSMFPDSYPEYCRKVPRIFPSLSTIIKLDIIEYLPIKINWFQKEIGSILALLLLVLLVESLRGISKVGLKAYLAQSTWLFIPFILFTILIILLNQRMHQKK